MTVLSGHSAFQTEAQVSSNSVKPRSKIKNPPPPSHLTERRKIMDKKSSLISSSSYSNWVPVRDYTRALIQSPCPSCKNPMPAFQRYRLDKIRVLSCTCGYRRCVNEDGYEDITGLCFVCGKQDCCASDHKLHIDFSGIRF